MELQDIKKTDRLEKQIQFIIEIDKLKAIRRQTLLMNRSRQENDAEHSWHIAVMAVLLSEYTGKQQLNLLRVIQMLLIHDLVEIDAGDTFCYDETAALGKAERERIAADRIFNILPVDQATLFRELWDEFESRQTPEACFASAIDRLQPVLHNYNTEGETWKKNGITRTQVVSRNLPLKDTAPELWNYFTHIMDNAVNKGLLKD